LGRRGLGRETGGVGRPAAREHLPLHLVDLPFQPLQALIRRRRLSLSDCARGNQQEAGDGRDRAELKQ
jgi:hypothetical protein